MVAPAAVLTVNRTSPRDAGHRQIVISLDDEPWVTLLNGQSATREIPPGRHTLKADNTLMNRTLELDLAPGEHAAFTVTNLPGPGMWLFMMLGSPLLRLSLEREGAGT